MIYKYFEEAKFHDAAFYKDRPVSDHIHEEGHRERLLRTLADVGFCLDVDKDSKNISDLGCGNGGLLKELKKRFPEHAAFGYDLSPKAVEFGRDHYEVNIMQCDFVNCGETEVGDVVVLSEVLEHLVDPVALLKKLRGKSRWLVVSCPSQENEFQHYEFHLWAWDMNSFRHMFEKLGYMVIFHYNTPMVTSQFLVARNL